MNLSELCIRLLSSRNPHDTRISISIDTQTLLFTDTRCRNRNRSFSAFCVGRRHRTFLQPLGKDSNASAISARLQAGSIKSARYRVRNGCLQWAAFASGNTSDGNTVLSFLFYQLFRFQLPQQPQNARYRLKRVTHKRGNESVLYFSWNSIRSNIQSIVILQCSIIYWPSFLMTKYCANNLVESYLCPSLKLNIVKIWLRQISKKWPAQLVFVSLPSLTWHLLSKNSLFFGESL